MRAPKQSDSPCGYTRDVYYSTRQNPPASRPDLTYALACVEAEIHRQLREHPHLDGEDPRVLFSRMITPETSPDHRSAVRRAAFAVLLVRAVDRAELADPNSGDEAA